MVVLRWMKRGWGVPCAVACLGLGVLLLGCARGAQLAEGVVATYRGGAVTGEEFAEHFRSQMRREAYDAFMGDISRKKEGVRVVVFQRIVSELAAERGLHQESGYLEKLDGFRVKRLSDLMRREIGAGVAVDDGELAELLSDVARRVTVSWVSFAERDSAEAFRSRVEGGEDFFAVLEELMAAGEMVSTGESLVTEGHSSRLTPAGEEALLNLAVGGVGPVLQLETGFLVAKVIAKADPGAERAGQMERLRLQLLPERRAEAVAARLEQLRAAASIMVNERGLESFGEGEVVASVNGRVVTAGAISHQMKDHENAPGVRRSLLDELIEDILLANEAERLALHEREEFLAAQERFSSETLRQLYLERYISSEIEAGEDDARAYYEDNPDAFKSAVWYHVKVLILRSQFLAERFRKEITEGRKTFEEMAREQSEDRESAARGGDLGWIEASKVNSPFREILESMEAGDVSEPVFADERSYVLKVEEKKGGEAVGYEMVRVKALQMALLRKKAEAIEDFSERVLKEAQVEIDEEALASVGP